MNAITTAEKTLRSSTVEKTTVENTAGYLLLDVGVSHQGWRWIVNKEKKSALELVVGIGSSLDENNDRTMAPPGNGNDATKNQHMIM